jgi:diguanylate cyclase (GGDEF)-like protein
MKPTRHSWLAYLGAGLLGIVVYYALPRGGLTQGLVITVLALSSAVALAIGVSANPPGQRPFWYVVCLGQVLYCVALAGWFPYSVLRGRPLSYPSVADALWLTTYCLLVGALARAIKPRDPGQDRASLLDALIVTVAAAVLAWPFVLSPGQRPSGLLVAAVAVSYAYPALDIVMLAMVVRLAFTMGKRPPSFYLVALGLVSQLTADTGFAIASLAGTYRYGSPTDAGWMAMCILLGTAALHPRAEELTKPAIDQERSTPAWRFALLGGSVLTPSVTIIVMDLRRADDDVAVVAALAAILSLLALARVAHLTRVIAGRRQAHAAAERERLLLQLLQAGALAANEAATVPAALGRVLSQMGMLLGWPLGRAVLVGSDTNAAPIWHLDNRGEFAEMVRQLDQPTGIDELARTAVDAGRPVWATSLPAPLAALGLQSALSVPVIVGTEAVAVVQFLTDELYEPDRGLLEVAASIATQLARVFERVRGQDELARQALHDPLTGLPNRALFHDRLAQAVADAARRDEHLAVTLLDLDGFKEVNDNLGHAAGDHILVEVADRVRSCLRATDTAARIGGDELAVVLPATGRAEAEAVTSRILERIRHPVVLDGREVLPQASAGIALWEHGQELDSLLRNADAAMYAAKQERSSSYEVYDQDLHARVLDRISLASDLRGALRRGQFVLYYQPIVEAATGRIAGAEALIRWHHPQRGSVSPAHFIPVAEQTGAIVEIGRWVLETACREAQGWHRDHPSRLPLYVSVNLSPRQLRDAGLASDIQETLAATGFPAKSLTLEITETAVITDIDRAIDKLRELKGLGVRIAIDDFGTGYSSLTYLRRLPIDVVKIDRSFVAGVAAASDEWALAQSIVRLIRTLKLETVAEGVETGAQVAHLRALGCDRLQGYYFARAEPADTFRELLTAPSRTAAPGS